MSTNVNNTYFSTTNSRILNFAKIAFSFNKKKRKKIISVYGLIAELNRCFLLNTQFCFYYNNIYITRMLSVLQSLYVISNFYNLNLKSFGFLSNYFISFVYVIFCHAASIYTYAKKAITYIYIISRPQRMVYIKYKQLILLLENKNNTSYILNTTSGLILSQKALQQRQGGQLLCKII